MIIVLASGCNFNLFTKDDPASVSSYDQEDDITLNFSVPSWLSDAEYRQFIAEPIATRHPHINLNKIKQLNQNFAANPSAQQLDLILLYTWQLPQLEQLQWSYEMETIIKSQNFDVNTLEPVAIDAALHASSNHSLLAIPYALDFSALYYNKSIFDQFNIEYPLDQMYWEELIALAKLVSGNHHGKTYGGFGFADLSVEFLFASLPYVDPESMTAAVNTEAWRSVLQFAKEIYEIPGNEKMIIQAEPYFSQQQTLAMMLAPNILTELNDDFRWDLAATPILKAAPDTGRMANGLVLAITESSEYKNEAMQVIIHLLSEEVQLELAQNGRPSVLKASRFKQVFGENMPYLTEKNLEAVFASIPTKPLATSPYDSFAQQFMLQTVISSIEQGMEIEAALQIAEEQINNYITNNQEN